MIYESLEADKINSSKKITDYKETKRLKNIVNELLPPGFSAIVRSAAEGKDESDIAKEAESLLEQCAEYCEWQQKNGPTTLWSQSTLVKTLKEVVAEDVDEIIIDDKAAYDAIREEFLVLYPDFCEKIKFFDKEENIFDAHFVKTQIEKLHEKRVWLRSGGFIVIEQTEACVVIDVNTGKLQSKGGEAAKVALNIEAAREICYQLRLRNLSGIVIIDFLRTQSKQDMHKLLEELEMELDKDRIPALLVGMTTLGLVEVTRKRVRKPLRIRNESKS